MTVSKSDHHISLKGLGVMVEMFYQRFFSPPDDDPKRGQTQYLSITSYYIIKILL